MRTRIIESAESFQQVRELWHELSQGHGTRGKACASTIFQSYAWNEMAARVFAERERPYVVVAENESGAAIVPACVREGCVSLLGEELFDYRSALSNDGECLRTAWEQVMSLGLSFRVKGVLEFPFGEKELFAGAPYLPATKRLERNKKLERNLRRLRESGCCVALAASLETKGILRCAQDDHLQTENQGLNIRSSVRHMYELKGRQESGGLFTDPVRIEAVAQMAESAPSELWALQRDGELVAGILTFLDGGVCRFYGTYYDAHWRGYSPGVSLLYAVIRNAQRRGLAFDFMTGEQPYKMRFATEVRPLYRVLAAAFAGAVSVEHAFV